MVWPFFPHGPSEAGPTGHKLRTACRICKSSLLDAGLAKLSRIVSHARETILRQCSNPQLGSQSFALA